MGRTPNDGRGRLGGRLAGSKNRPKSYKAFAAKIIDEDRRQQQPMGNHVTLLAALVVAEALAALVAVLATSHGLTETDTTDTKAEEGSVCS